jgi:hypothetical protein
VSPSAITWARTGWSRWARHVWVRCLVGSLLWFVLAGASTALYSFDSDSGLLTWVSLAIAAVGTVLLGYVVGNWWALAVPILTFVVLDAFIAATNDPEAGTVAVVLWVLVVPIAFLIWPGIMWRRGQDSEK